MPVAATVVMGVFALIACFIPFDVLLNATGSTLAFSYGFIALAALVVRRQTDAAARAGEDVTGVFRMPLYPLAPIASIVAIASIFVIGILDPAQWVSLGVAIGIVVAGFAYYGLYLRRNPGTAHLLAAEDVEPERAE
jgi:L-asparagine transporter-like permease